MEYTTPEIIQMYKGIGITVYINNRTSIHIEKCPTGLTLEEYSKNWSKCEGDNSKKPRLIK